MWNADRRRRSQPRLRGFPAVGGLRFEPGFGLNYALGWTTGWGPGWQPYPFAAGINLIPLAILLYLVFGGRKSAGKRRR